MGSSLLLAFLLFVVCLGSGFEEIKLIWTPRGAARRIISMRYAKDREKKKIIKFLD